jgi:hypothetical protein
MVCVHLHQALPVVQGTHYVFLRQELSACLCIQPGQAQRTYRRAAALQGYQVGRFLPGGEQQATLVPGLAHPAQQSAIALEACTHAARPLPFLQQHLQVV